MTDGESTRTEIDPKIVLTNKHNKQGTGTLTYNRFHNPRIPPPHTHTVITVCACRPTPLFFLFIFPLCPSSGSAGGVLLVYLDFWGEEF